MRTARNTDTATTAMTDRYDCRRCGACCAPLEDNDVYVDLVTADVLRMKRRFREHAVRRFTHYAALRTKRDKRNGTTCVALRGTIGARVSCAIYARRPALCSAFDVGSKSCREARAERGLPV